MMFQHVFAEMNEMLDEIARHYPIVQGAHKHELARKWRLLRQMSDSMIEEWLNFEEKMGVLRQSGINLEEKYELDYPEMSVEAFVKGQGYYKLLMFPQSLKQFQAVLEEYPESLIGRTYLAMCHLHLEQSDEAVDYFEEVLKAAANKRLRSIIYNALGCIEAKRGVRSKAREYFTLAYHSDPTLPEPLANWEACLHSTGKLQYGTQLTSLL
ncbi:tetratricopeptide repeat protein [Paenibacillus bouchesdurhonensis]|uniref:tetratricopeptide repeat protein n=1 Tax=Paenibacillus bouchesdurhonensis TaxID=1870990 RepID=UPI0019027FAB|nr:tetratricopeptide repeat protein [Paenibacillus bouchesdurhonensis]